MLFAMLPIFVLALSAALLLLFVNKAAPESPLRTTLGTRRWIKLRFGEELHFDVQNSTERSFMMIALSGTKTHVFTVTPYSHAVYTPLFRLPSGSTQSAEVQLRFLDEQSVLLQDPVELFIPLTGADGSLFSYCEYGDLASEITLLEAENGAFKAVYLAE